VDQSVNCNWNEVDKKFASTAAAGGAKWDGTAGNGPLIDITTSLGSGGFSRRYRHASRTDAHAAAADPHTVYLLKAGGTLTGTILLPSGSAAAPAWAWASDTDTGFLQGASGRTTYSRNNQKLIGFGGNGLNFPSALWYSVDRQRQRSGDKHRTSRSGATWPGKSANASVPLATTKRSPKSTRCTTCTALTRDRSRRNLIAMGWNGSNKAMIATQSAGTNGSARDLYVGPDGNACYYVQSNGAAVWKSLRGGRLAAGGQ